VERGYTGHGRLVCNFDTGVEGTHPALVANWLGANGGTASQSWFDPYGTTSRWMATVTHPYDGHHGRRDGADTIGVAFNASWISAAVVDRGQNLSKTVSDILAAFQWAADPDGNPQTVDDLPTSSAIPGAFRGVYSRRAIRRSIKRLTISKHSAW